MTNESFNPMRGQHFLWLNLHISEIEAVQGWDILGPLLTPASWRAALRRGMNISTGWHVKCVQLLAMSCGVWRMAVDKPSPRGSG